ncbi:hypothetical protein G9A89_014447 [Geosiphon pyriformis]|nr:hypothetical protein G9A89_014447 [Geosiphon pyriformis]
MAYAPIAKLDNFTGEENNIQIWLNDIEKAITANRWNNARAMQAIPYFLKDTANSWYQSLVNKPQDFNAFKAEFLRYFSNNNSINCLVNTFTTMKQEETKAVTTYLGCFYQNLHQIQAIDANYFTAPQILNQFICGLHSSILQHVRLLHPGTLQDAVTHARDFKSAESEANYAQAINLVMNGLSELNSKLEKFMTQSLIYQSLVYQAPIYQPQPQMVYQQPQPQIIYQPQQIQTPPQSLPPNRTQRLRMTQQSWRLVMVVHQLIPSSSQQPSELCQRNLSTGQTQNPNSQNYLSLLVTTEDALTNNSAFAQKQPLTSNIPSVTITKNKSLAAIFPFKFEETAAMPLFSGAALEAKPIIMMYTNAKVEGQSIKLILGSGSAGSIITQQLMDQLSH